MSPHEKDAKRQLLAGMLLLLSADDFQHGSIAAMGVPAPVARMLGLVKEPQERLDKYADAQNQRMAYDEARKAHEAAIAEHDHGPDCTGDCGALWFYSTLADKVMDMLVSDADAVDAFLSDLQGGQHA